MLVTVEGLVEAADIVEVVLGLWGHARMEVHGIFNAEPLMSQDTGEMCVVRFRVVEDDGSLVSRMYKADVIFLNHMKPRLLPFSICQRAADQDLVLVVSVPF